MTESDTLDTALKALAHPVRRAILAQLAQNDQTVNDLAEPFDMSLPAVSRHIKVLEDAGLITRGRNAQFRPCQINPAPIKAVLTWAESYRPIWEARFDKMETLLNAKKETNND
ncbi:metalloregulator ArsR/SmtB family transcription factor [Octadecabacter sp.]|nr:metalloregulator ArsR/SmtB family transcription factor [Octadecabacter sp.]